MENVIQSQCISITMRILKILEQLLGVEITLARHVHKLLHTL